jgi:hypothetical protein
MQLKNLFRSPATEAGHVSAEEAGYASWRGASVAVTQAYRAWAAAPRGQRFLAHAAYLAALEREECAASAYQALIEQRRADADRTISW